MYRCAYVGGTFDCLHRAHLALFAKVRTLAERTVVSVNTDEFAARYKRVPLMPLADRLAVLGSCRLVDQVMLNDGDEDSTKAILRSGASVVIHGTDWPRESLMRQMNLTEPWLQEHGIDLLLLPHTPWTSTSELLEAYNARRAS